MKPKNIAMLLMLAAMWGASFLFMRIGAPVLGPFVLIFLRVFIAGLALLIYVRLTRQKASFMHKWKQYLVLGLLNAAIPFTLISAAELHLSASLAAILNATTPLFTALVAWVWTNDRLTLKKISGLILGIIGVAVLVGWDPHHSGDLLLVSASFSLLAAISYAFAGVYSSRAFKGEKPLNIAIGQQLGASVFMLPFAGSAIPQSAPSLTVTAAVIGLAVVCTSLAYLLYFGLIRDVGAIKTLSVTFLVPVFGLAWGAMFLGEAISPSIIIGLILILFSVILVLNIPLKQLAGVAAEPASQKN